MNHDLALMRRMVYLPFDYSIPTEEQDKELLTKLEAKRDVVFSLAARTLKEFVESENDFKMSPKAKAYLESHIAALHSVDSFLGDRASIDENVSVSTASLYEAYKLWCNYYRTQKQADYWVTLSLMSSGLKKLNDLSNNHRLVQLQ